MWEKGQLWIVYHLAIQAIIADQLQKKQNSLFLLLQRNFNPSSTSGPNSSKWKSLEVGEHVVQRQSFFQFFYHLHVEC